MAKNIDRQYRLARIWSNNELKKFSSWFTEKVINVSAGENIDKQGSTYDSYFSECKEFWTSNYSPGSYRGFTGKKNELLIDLEKDIKPELHKRFDVVYNHTTLEHVFNVFKAVENICNLSKDIVILVVPFAQVQHESDDGYLDYWRFTPTCVRRLFKERGFEVIYESCNNDFNAAVYLFFIASRNPDKWQDKFPEYKPISLAGEWIGKETKKKWWFF